MDLKQPHLPAHVERQLARPPARHAPATAAADADRRAAPRSALREAAFDTGPVAQIVVDRKRHLAAGQRAGARRSSTSPPRDLGRLLQDLEISYRPVELRSHIEHGYADRARR